RATFDFSDKLEAFANFHFSNSNTSTRREPAPFSGGFGVVIPFYSEQDGDAVYLPSVITDPAPGQQVGQTRSEYLPGGTRGTNCAPVGGGRMSEAFPVPDRLRFLLESRPTSVITDANSPFFGLSACHNYMLATDPNVPGVQINPDTGAEYLTEIDPN